VRIGCATWMMGVSTLPESIQRAVECGARAVSFLMTPQKYQRPGDEQKILDLVGRHDLDVTCHNTLGRAEEEPDPLPRLQDEIDDIIEWHAASGRVRCVSFDPASHEARPGEEPIIDIEKTIELLKYTTDRLWRRGIPTAVENWLGNSNIDAFEATKQGVGNEALGALVDLGHLNIAVNTGITRGLSADEFITRMPLTIREVHVHYNDGIHDLHAPLEPHSIVIEQAVRALARRGFNGIATIEHGRSGDLPADLTDKTANSIRKSMSIFRKLFDQEQKDSQ